MEYYKAEAEKYIIDNKIPSKISEPVKDMVVSILSHEAFGYSDYRWSVDDFELGKRLGRGKFGRVYLAREKKTKYLVALKTLLKAEIVKNRVEKLVMREIEIQSHLKHPNILQLLTWFHDDFRIYFVLEYAAQGELFMHLQNAPGHRFGEPKAAKYIYQVADALHYCHNNQVIHRDIKPENLLLSQTGDIKVADFGWSVHTPSLSRKTMCGTLDYLCPEMIKGVPHSIHVDQWCLGVLCYEFLAGYPPFESETTDETYKNITKVKMTYPSYFSSGASDLIKKLLVRNEKERLTLPEVMKHPWILAEKILA